MKNTEEFCKQIVGVGVPDDPQTKNKGITLIALIITIIIMLILVGVTISVALNGGLFETAKKATSETTVEIAREELMSIVLGTIQGDGSFNASITKTALEDVQATVKNNKFPLQVIYKNLPFEVSVYGEVTYKETKKTPKEIAELITAENYNEYLELAKAAGQDTDNNTDIGIGTDGKVVNLDNWLYSKNIDNTISIVGDSNNGAYTGEYTEDGRIEGTVPEAVYSGGKVYVVTVMNFVFTTSDILIAPELPSTVIDLSYLFNGRSRDTMKLEVASPIPSGVQNVESMFINCLELRGEIIINSTCLTEIESMLLECGSETNRIILKGDCPQDVLEQIRLTGNSEYITIEK